jgi:hypothetical protein
MKNKDEKGEKVGKNWVDGEILHFKSLMCMNILQPWLKII